MKRAQPGTWTFVVRLVAQRAGVTQKEARRLLRAYSAVMRESVIANGRVVVPGFGTYKLSHRKARRVLAKPGAAEFRDLPAQTRIRFTSTWREKS